LDSWLLDVDYENFCKKLKPILKKKLREIIHNNPNIKDIISKMEVNKNNPKKLKGLSEKLK
jgi:CRISPR/Cas system endoribonuclease Cas6 (RAMP superfamily)